MSVSIHGNNLTFLIIDVGESVTNGILIEKVDGYKVRGHRATQTTVGPPYLDVTVGVITVVKEIEEKTGCSLLSNGNIITPRDGDGSGVDYFLCTSSTGGGLQMVVSGVIRTMTAESARRAVLGAGAYLMDIFSLDDDRFDFEKIEQVRRLKPDIFLLAGGTDGGQVEHVVRTAELIERADPEPRFGADFKLPIIYAGNRDAREGVTTALSDGFALKITENIRPSLEVENLGPAREAIYNDFMEHVIIHQPGYEKMAKWTQTPIIPTQAAIGEMINRMAHHYRHEVIGVDVEEATIDIYSSFKGVFNRSLNASIGLNFGACNIMKNVGVDRIFRWIPVKIEENELRNIIANKMVRIQDTPLKTEEIYIEQALAREGIRLAFEEHKELAVNLRGVARASSGDRAIRTEKISPRISRDESPSFVNMMNLDMIIGMGVLSRTNNVLSALVLIDALQPEGITQLALVSKGIFPHLGMLNRLNQDAAIEVLENYGLLRLGTCIAPKGVTGDEGEVMAIKVKTSDENIIERAITYGKLDIIPLEKGRKAEVEIIPANKNFDVGEGAGRPLNKIVNGGVIGIIIDARGRPLSIPEDEVERMTKQVEWREMFTPYVEDFRVVNQ